MPEPAQKLIAAAVKGGMPVHEAAQLAGKLYRHGSGGQRDELAKEAMVVLVAHRSNDTAAEIAGKACAIADAMLATPWADGPNVNTTTDNQGT